MTIPYEERSLTMRLTDHDNLVRLNKEINQLQEELTEKPSPMKAVLLQKKQELYDNIKNSYFVVVE